MFFLFSSSFSSLSFELFVLPLCFPHASVFELSLYTIINAVQNLQSLAGTVSSVLVLRQEEGEVLCSERCGLMPRPLPRTLWLLPLYCCSLSGQTVFMLLDEWNKKENRARELLLAATF